MIEKDFEFGTYLVSCDTRDCAYDYDYDTDENWDELMRQMRLDGWKSQKDNDGDWCNYCPNCSTKTKNKDKKNAKH